jgi:hypothetical protein
VQRLVPPTVTDHPVASLMRRQKHIPPRPVHPTHVTSPTNIDQVDSVHLMRHPKQVRPAPRCGWSNPCIWCRKIDE